MFVILYFVRCWKRSGLYLRRVSSVLRFAKNFGVRRIRDGWALRDGRQGAGKDAGATNRGVVYAPKIPHVKAACGGT
jgi:hypothetical protein